MVLPEMPGSPYSCCFRVFGNLSGGRRRVTSIVPNCAASPHVRPFHQKANSAYRSLYGWEKAECPAVPAGKYWNKY